MHAVVQFLLILYLRENSFFPSILLFIYLFIYYLLFINIIILFIYLFLSYYC